MSDQADLFLGSYHDPREWDTILVDMFWKTFLFRPILGHSNAPWQGTVHLEGTAPGLLGPGPGMSPSQPACQAGALCSQVAPSNWMSLLTPQVMRIEITRPSPVRSGSRRWTSPPPLYFKRQTRRRKSCFAPSTFIKEKWMGLRDMDVARKYVREDSSKPDAWKNASRSEK